MDIAFIWIQIYSNTKTRFKGIKTDFFKKPSDLNSVIQIQRPDLRGLRLQIFGFYQSQICDIQIQRPDLRGLRHLKK